MNGMEPSRIRVKSDFLLGIESRIIQKKVDEKMNVWELSQLVPDAENEKFEMNKSMLFLSGKCVSQNSIINSFPIEIVLEILKLKTELCHKEAVLKKNLQIEIFKIESEEEYNKSMSAQIKMI